MGALKRVAVADIICRGSIKDADVARLSRARKEDGAITQDEAERLIALNQSCPVQAPTWRDFFIHTLTEHTVSQSEPEGYLTAEKSKWLISRISRGGRIRTRSELDLLLTILHASRWAPVSLVSFAMAQVRDTVLRGDGPLRAGKAQVKGVISTREVDLVRDLLCAFSADAMVALTRTEAEVLFEINGALAGRPIARAWADLFAKSVTNMVLAASGYTVPSRRTALRPDGLSDMRRDLSSRAAMASAVALSLSSVGDIYTKPMPGEGALSRLERQRIEIVTNEEIPGGEMQWLSERLLSQSSLSPLEEALFAHLCREKLIAGPLFALTRKRGGQAA